MTELVKMNMEEADMSEDEVAEAGIAVLNYLEGLSKAEYLFAEYGIKVDGVYYE